MLVSNAAVIKRIFTGVIPKVGVSLQEQVDNITTNTSDRYDRCNEILERHNYNFDSNGAYKSFLFTLRHCTYSHDPNFFRAYIDASMVLLFENFINQSDAILSQVAITENYQLWVREANEHGNEYLRTLVNRFYVQQQLSRY